MKRFINLGQIIRKQRWLRFSCLMLITFSLCWGIAPSRASSITPQNLMQQGRQFYEAGQFEQALKHWQAATTAYGDDGVGVAGSLINQGQALSAMGLQRRACKTLVNALSTNLSSATPVNDQICDPVFAQVPFTPSSLLPTELQAMGLGNLGNVLRVIGNLEAAQSVLLQSWRIAPKPLQPAILLNLGNVTRDLGNRDRDRIETLNLPTTIGAGTDCLSLPKRQTAGDYYQQAIACYQQTARVTSSTASLQAQLNHLSLLLDVKQWLERNDQVETANRWANDTQTQIAALTTQLSTQLDQLPLTYEGLFARMNFARSLALQDVSDKRTARHQTILLASKEPSSDRQFSHLKVALQLLESTLETAKALNQVTLETYATGNLGWLYEQVGNLSEAATWTDQALNLASRLQAPDLLYQWEWQKGRILRQQGKLEGAITAYKHAIRALQSTRDELIAINPDAQFSLRDTTEPIHRELIDLLLQPERPSQAALQSAIELVDSLRLAEMEDFLRCRLAEVRVVSVDKVEDPTAAIFYPIVLRDRVEVILKLPGQADLIRYRANLPRQVLNQQIQEFQRQLQDPASGADVKTVAKRIYDWLLKDALMDLAQSKIQTLVFVPDGGLRNISIASLYDGKNYLIERYAIVATPGLEILGPKRIASRPLNALIAGLEIERKVSVNGKSRTFKALENVPIEIQQIQSSLQQSQTLLNQEFTTQALLAETGETSYPVLHLATHGQFSSNPDETFILTASDQPMTVNQMQVLVQMRNQRQKVPIELLVFSACETATGDRRATLGLAGIALRSGALGTLASLWAVDDASTATLMGQFYQSLAQTGSSQHKAEALRQAQRSLLQDSRFSHPYYWSPFVLVGNWL